MIIDTILTKIKSVFEKIKTPANTLPAMLLYCISMKRPGVSAYNAAAKAISDNVKLGINAGVNPDGTPKAVNQYTYNIIKNTLDEIKQNGVVQVAIPPGSIKVIVKGSNAGGAFIAEGQNVITTTVKGIVQ